MKIKRTLDVSKATYDLTELSHEEFRTLLKAYEHYTVYTRHKLPAEDDSLYNKMRKMADDHITVL